MTMQEILGTLRRAICTHRMIANGDKIAVGVSGGKDSLTLLAAMRAYQRFSPEKFELHAITIDMGFKNADPAAMRGLKDYAESLEVPFTSVETDIGEVVFDIRKESNPCSLCSKMRRGALCEAAKSLGYHKIALGHHADDLNETLLLSLFYEGRLSTFQPVSYMDRTQITLIRPLLYTEEKNIRAFARDLPVMKSACPADGGTKRKYMKDLIQSIQKDIPFVKQRIFGAITHPERYRLFTEEAKERSGGKTVRKHTE